MALAPINSTPRAMPADAIERPRYTHPGQPTKYRPEFCDRAIELGRDGKSRAQIAREFDVSRSTLLNWADEHAEFLNALDRARELELAWWEDQGQKGIESRDFNAQAFKFQVINRFRDDYVGDRAETELSGPGGSPLMPLINVSIGERSEAQQPPRLTTVDAKALEHKDVERSEPVTHPTETAENSDE